MSNLTTREIDEKLEMLQARIDEISAENKRLTSHNDAIVAELLSQMKNLRKERKTAFLREMPVVYVIVGEARATREGYSDFETIRACFRTRDAAKAALSQRRTSVTTRRYSITYSVKAEATENVSKDILKMIDDPNWLCMSSPPLY